MIAHGAGRRLAVPVFQRGEDFVVFTSVGKPAFFGKGPATQLHHRRLAANDRQEVEQVGEEGVVRRLVDPLVKLAVPVFMPVEIDGFRALRVRLDDRLELG